METGSCYLFSSCPGWDRGWLGFCGGSAGKESACSAGDLGLIPGLGRSLGQGKGYPVQHPFLENAPGCIVPGAGKSRHTERPCPSQPLAPSERLPWAGHRLFVPVVSRGAWSQWSRSGYCSRAGGSPWCLGPGWRPGVTRVEASGGLGGGLGVAWEPRRLRFPSVFPFVHFRAQHSPLQEMFWSCSLFSSDPKRIGESSHAEGGSG